MTMMMLIEKIAVLLTFALAMLLLNLKAGTTWLKCLSLWAMIAAFAGAGWFTAAVVFA